MTGRYKSYSEYKHSGKDYYGTIPSHWKLEKIKYNSYVKGRQGWQNLRADEYRENGPYLVTGSHFDNYGGVDWKKCHHVSQERYDRDRDIWINKKDVLVTKDGTIGKIAFIDNLPDNACLNSHLLIIRDLYERYDQKFLYHLLTSSCFKGFIPTRQSGTTFMGITQEAIEEYPLLICPLKEQKNIAAFLDHETAKIDTLIAKQEKLIELLKEKRHAVISHAVTKGLNPDAPMKDSGVEWLGEVPEHWSIKRLKHISPKVGVGLVINPSTYTKDEGVYFIFGGDVKEYGFDLSNTRRISKEDSDSLLPSRLNHKDLVSVRVGNPGITAVVPEALQGANCASVVVIRSGKYNSDWLCAQMNSWVGRQQVDLVAYGAAQKQFNIADAVEFRFPYPPLVEQNDIAKFISSTLTKFDILIGKALRSIELMKERKNALISAAVTGKIDVRDWQPSTEVVSEK